MNNLHNKGFPVDWLEQLKARNDIVSTISRYIPLSRKGKLFWGACPFHFEKTPSMAVNEVEQFYHCFGCGVSGDVIRFVEKMESVDFWEAVTILAKHAGMELPTLVSGDVIKAKHAKKELYLRILKEAAIHYRENLRSGKAKLAIEYLNKRGLNSASISKFGIGASLGYNEVKDHLLSKGFKVDDIYEAGVLDKKNDSYFDAYSARLIFPLINSYGDVVGFSGRLLEDKEFAKYKNTRDTLVFDKSRTVFAINLIKAAKQKNELKNIVLVEGQIDVISLHQAGFNNVVACLGTALTPAHVRELKRFSDNITLCFDGDGAGKKAALRSLDIILEGGANCKVAEMPDGFDPDDYVRKSGADKFTTILNSATEAIDYKLKVLASEFDLTSHEQKARFVSQAVGILRGLKTDSEREIYLKVVSNYANISVDIIRRDMFSAGSEKQSTVASQNAEHKETPVVPDAYIAADIFILASLLHKQTDADFKVIGELEFMDSDFKVLLEFVKESHQKGEKPNVSGVYTRIEVDANPNLEAIIQYNFEATKFTESEFRECVLKNKQRSLQIEQGKLQQEFGSCTDAERKKAILYRLQDITKSLTQIKQEQFKIQTTRREDN